MNMFEKFKNLFHDTKSQQHQYDLTEVNSHEADGPFYDYNQKKVTLLNELHASPHPSLSEPLTPDSISATDIVVLWWVNNPRTDKNAVPDYFYNGYGIDLHDKIQSLIHDGFISENMSLPDHSIQLIDSHSDVIKNHKEGIYVAPLRSSEIFSERHELDVALAIYCLQQPTDDTLAQSQIHYFKNSLPRVLSDAQKRLGL